MGVVENIMSAVILMFIMLISGLVYMGSFAHDAIHNAGVKEDVFFDDAHINNLNNLLKITEPISQRPFGILLADAVYYRNNSLVFNNQSINITQKFSELIELSLGTNEYYFELKPRIIEVSMNFIIDGSPSLSEERKILATNLNGIIKSIEKKINESNKGYDRSDNSIVKADVFILGKSDNEGCRNFTDLGHSCQIIGGNELYLKDEEVNESMIIINNTRLNIESFLNEHNMTPPYDTDWPDGNQYPNPNDYYEADWGYGMGYASHRDEKTTLAKLTLLFPMSDELSTSSIPENCFSKNYQEFIVCSLCDDTCPVDRSLASVNKGIKIAKENLHVINPIFSYGCEYNYFYGDGINYDTATSDSGWNKHDSYNSYTGGFGVDGPGQSLCSNTGCGGCYENTSSKSICFHPNCAPNILDQMNLAANETGGQVISLSDIDNMDVYINETIETNIDQFLISLGEKIKTRQRDVIEVSQPLPNGHIVDIKLWVYKN
jgi:hypothetical protein